MGAVGAVGVRCQIPVMALLEAVVLVVPREAEGVVVVEVTQEIPAVLVALAARLLQWHTLAHPFHPVALTQLVWLVGVKLTFRGMHNEKV